MAFGMNARVRRDMKARDGVKASELVRRAYQYIARNQTVSPQVRYQAQLQLNNFGRYERPAAVKDRCTDSGRGRGVLSKFGLCRVCPNFLYLYMPVWGSRWVGVLTNECLIVPIQTSGTEWRHSRREEGFVVDNSPLCFSPLIR